MSWSIQKTIGSSAAVKAAVEPQFDMAAKNYAGQAEEQDVLAAKAAVSSWLDNPRASATGGVIVEASGSRGQGWLSITVQCSEVQLKV
jgi:hypothetical protein